MSSPLQDQITVVMIGTANNLPKMLNKPDEGYPVSLSVELMTASANLCYTEICTTLNIHHTEIMTFIHVWSKSIYHMILNSSSLTRLVSISCLISDMKHDR